MEISRENEVLKRRSADADDAAAAAGAELEGLRCVTHAAARVRFVVIVRVCRSAMNAAQQPHA